MAPDGHRTTIVGRAEDSACRSSRTTSGARCPNLDKYAGKCPYCGVTLPVILTRAIARINVGDYEDMTNVD